MERRDDVTAVVAHSVLGPVLACQTAAQTLLDRADQLTPALREELLRLLLERAALAADLLHDIRRGAGPGLVEILDRIDAR